MSAVIAPEPKTTRFQEKREAILNAAALKFNEMGVHGATLADIAASVGLATNSVTYYYRKKEDLAAACFLRAIARFDEIARQAAQAPDVPQRLRDFLRLHAELLAGIQLGQQGAMVQFGDLRALPSPHLEQVHDAYVDMFRHVRALFKGPESAHWARDTVHARTHLLLHLAHWMQGWLTRYDESEYTRMAERAADVALNGIGSTHAAWNDAQPALAWRAEAQPGPTESFLRAATALVNEQGYRGASIDRISARLNVTKGSFYHHHDNKFDLISACFDRTFAVFRQALQAAESQGGSGWTRACSTALALVRFQLSAEGPLLRMSSASALPAAADRDRVYRTMQRLTERMGSVLVDGLVDGSLRAQDPAVAANLIVAMINSAAELHRWVPGATEASVAALLARPAFMGLLCAEDAAA